MSDSARLVGQDRLRLTDSMLRAVEESVASLQRLLSEVRREVDRALSDAAEWERHEELHALRQEMEQLREGFNSRAVIERAKGILMQGHALSEAQAFDFLNELSQRRHRKLRDVAADVVNGSLPSRLGVGAPETTVDRPPAQPVAATSSGLEKSNGVGE